MRNKYSGTCYYCGNTVQPKQGHFERYKGGWRVIHADCVFLQRKEKYQSIDAQQHLRTNKNTCKKVRPTTSCRTFEEE